MGFFSLRLVSAIALTSLSCETRRAVSFCKSSEHEPSASAGLAKRNAVAAPSPANVKPPTREIRAMPATPSLPLAAAIDQSSRPGNRVRSVEGNPANCGRFESRSKARMRDELRVEKSLQRLGAALAAIAGVLDAAER